jgi:hypothetical protein
MCNGTTDEFAAAADNLEADEEDQADRDSLAATADGTESGPEQKGAQAPASESGSDTGTEQTTGNAFDVRYDVPLITQPDEMTCWAASLAMIQSFRDQASYDVDYFAGAPPHTWMSWSRIEPLAASLGFVEIASADLQPAGWHDLLSTHGPLWIVIKGAVSNASSHAVVLVGIVGDGSLEGTQMTSNNPTGLVEQQSFTDFANRWDFGAVAGASIFAPQ